MQVYMLQSPHLEKDGAPIFIPYKRAEALLYYMIVNRSATRQELISLFWEDHDETTGLKNLRNTIYVLKKTLGENLLLTPHKSIIILNDAFPLECDYTSFVRDKDPSRYKGAFLQGFAIRNSFAFEEWCSRIRDKTRQLYICELRNGALQKLDADVPEEAARLCEAALREDPYDESVACLLMQCLARAHNFPHVSRVYEQLKERLCAELGTAPLKSTTALYYELMGHWNEQASEEESTGRNPAPNSGAAPLCSPAHTWQSLSTAARLAAAHLSLFPRGASADVLQRLAAEQAGALMDGLAELKQSGIVIGHPDNHEELLVFAQEELREYICLHLPPAEKRTRHAMAAAVLASARPFSGEALRHIAWHHAQADNTPEYVTYTIRALELDSAIRCEPFAIVACDGKAGETLAGLKEEVAECMRLLSVLKRKGSSDPLLLQQCENEITLIRGRLSLFEDAFEDGSSLLGQLSDTAGNAADSSLLSRACYLLAISCLLHEDAGRAERYIITGTRFLARTGEPLEQIRFHMLRGLLYLLRNDTEKGLYYAQDAMQELQDFPFCPELSVQQAGCAFACALVCLRMQRLVSACKHFKKALASLQSYNGPGMVWIYVHYGRAARCLEDHAKASELFLKACDTAEQTGEPWGQQAAFAYAALYHAEAERHSQARHCLSRAFSILSHGSTPLEEGILYLVCVLLLDYARLHHLPTSVTALLTEADEQYARKGIRALGNHGNTAEYAELTRRLEEMLRNKKRYKAFELYGKSKNYIAE